MNLSKRELEIVSWAVTCYINFNKYHASESDKVDFKELDEKIKLELLAVSKQKKPVDKYQITPNLRQTIVSA